MTIDKAYRLTKGKYDKPAKAKQKTGKKEPAPEYEGLPVSGEVNQLPGDQTERDLDRLERLEVWVHRENLNIPPGNDARRDAARSMLQNLCGFTLPDEFTQDIHAMLQSLFQADLDGQAIPEAAIDAASPDMLGAGHEE
jgi:hypothetical protein